MRTGLKIIGVIILLLISAVVIPKFLSIDRDIQRENHPWKVVSGIGSALSSAITSKHAEYLKNGTPYTASDVVADTKYHFGITATTGAPRDWQISAVSPTTIRLNYKTEVFEWDYIPLNVDTGKRAYLSETGDNWDDLHPSRS